MILDKDMKERLLSVMMNHPESGRYYSREIGISPATLRGFLNDGEALNLRTLLLIKKFVEKEEKKL